MNNSLCKLTATPREGNVALCAEHLIASADLADDCGAVRTRLGIRADELYGLYKGLVALMLCSPFEAATESTDEPLADRAAVVSLLNESMTILGGAPADK